MPNLDHVRKELFLDARLRPTYHVWKGQKKSAKQNEAKKDLKHSDWQKAKKDLAHTHSSMSLEHQPRTKTTWQPGSKASPMGLPTELRLHIMEYIIINEGQHEIHYHKYRAGSPKVVAKNRPMLQTCTLLANKFRKILSEQTIHFMHRRFPAEYRGLVDECEFADVVEPSDQIKSSESGKLPKHLRLSATIEWMEEDSFPRILQYAYEGKSLHDSRRPTAASSYALLKTI